MHKIIFFILVFGLNMQVFSQAKHTFSLGGGPESLHNSYLSPYNLKGIRFFDISYSRDKTNEGSKWKSLWDIELGVSSLNTDFNFANKLQKGPGNLAFELTADKKYLYKFCEVSKLSVSAGGIAVLQSRYQVITFYPVNLGEKNYDYFEWGGSVGISTSIDLHLKKMIIQNISSCLLLNSTFLPNYSNDLPFPGNMITRYLTFSTINSKIHLNNELKIQFPFFYKNRFINSYSLSYTIDYEDFETKAVLYKNLSHVFTLGLIFTTQRMNILSREL
jgi:hypothetical protein